MESPRIVYTTNELSMIKIDLQEEVKLSYDSKLLIAFSQEHLDRLFSKQDICLEIIVANAAKMKLLNKKFRQKDMTTDVLSFPIWKTKQEINRQQGVINLGTIWLKSNKVANNITLAQDYIVHSIDHLIGKHHR